MKQIRLVDGSFSGNRSATLAGDNKGLGPKHFEWVRNDDQAGVTFFTDICLHHALEDKSPVKVAWLIEPPEISKSHYEFIIKHGGVFDYVLTWDVNLIDLSSDGTIMFYPFGGSWIKQEDWAIYPKSKLCSIIVSNKTKTQGHRLRHEIVKRFGDKIDVFGLGYNPIDSKLEALRDYKYSIVIENVRRDYWFTEKLLDCFATGTIPIYWGCDLGGFFNDFNVLYFNGIDKLPQVWEEGGQKLSGVAFKNNFREAQKYRCAEDWIFEHYPFLFE